jgi:hypothetical protein
LFCCSLRFVSLMVTSCCDTTQCEQEAANRKFPSLHYLVGYASAFASVLNQVSSPSFFSLCLFIIALWIWMCSLKHLRRVVPTLSLHQTTEGGFESVLLSLRAKRDFGKHWSSLESTVREHSRRMSLMMSSFSFCFFLRGG